MLLERQHHAAQRHNDKCSSPHLPHLLITDLKNGEIQVNANPMDLRERKAMRNDSKFIGYIVSLGWAKSHPG
jgi:hypothetical protein